MKTFTDNKGRDWQLTVDVNAVRRVRAEADVNLLDLAAHECALLTRLTTDLVLLVDVVYLVCRPQAQARNVTDEDFGCALSGDVLQTAADALVREIVGFFPDARRRAMLTAVLDKGQALGNVLMDRGLQQARRLEQIDLETEATNLMRAETAAPERNANPSASGSTGTAGTVPASSESTPGPIPSPN